MASRSKNIFEIEQPRVEIIPMIDIMMFLLVFFIMITLDMITNTGIQQELPGKAIPKEQQTVTKLIVALATSGEIKVNNTPVTYEGLVESFRLAKATEAQGAKVEVLIAPDKQVNLQRVISIMDLARAEKIDAVGVGTRKDSPPSKTGKIL